MRKSKKLFISIAFAILMVASFLAGSFVKEQGHNNDRLQRCNTLISFAIDKAENEDLSDQDIMEALISNVYAAYEFCDDSNLSIRLHDLWNVLIFEGDSFIGREDMLVEQLKIISESMKMKD